MKKLAKRQAGFTLMEIMIAMAILALIGVGALTILDAATNSGNKIRKNGDRLNDVQRAFLFISNDIQQISLRQVRDEYGDPVPALSSDLQSSTPYMRFTRLGRRNPAQLNRSNLEHLFYSIEDKALYKTSYFFSDGMSENHGLKRLILKDVENMELSFFDGDDWQTSWPLPSNGTGKPPPLLPVALKLELELTDYGKIERLYAISER